jgi:hypothetical protein
MRVTEPASAIHFNTAQTAMPDVNEKLTHIGLPPLMTMRMWSVQSRLRQWKYPDSAMS